MRRTRLRATLLIVVAAALGGLGYLVSQSMTARGTRVLHELGSDLLPQVAQRIQNFRRAKVEDGRTVWEITATEAQYFEQDNQIVVQEPRMTFFLQDQQRQAHVQGKEGRIALDGREVLTVTLKGGVAVRLDDLELMTEEATYDRARDVITSPDVVTVRGQTVELRGRGMEVDVGPQHVRLLDDVHTILRAHGESS